MALVVWSPFVNLAEGFESRWEEADRRVGLTTALKGLIDDLERPYRPTEVSAPVARWLDQLNERLLRELELAARDIVCNGLAEALEEPPIALLKESERLRRDRLSQDAPNAALRS